MMRGQEEAPIELLIGVTVLTFVLIIGMYVFNNSCSTQQEQKLKASFSTFASDLDYVYFGAQSTSRISRFDFSKMEGCGSYSIDSVRIMQGTSATCLKQIGKSSCLILIAVQKRTINGATSNYPLLQEVLNIPQNVKIVNKLSSSCGVDLNTIAYSDLNANAYPNCVFGSNYYTVKITKVSSDEIDLENLVPTP